MDRRYLRSPLRTAILRDEVSGPTRVWRHLDVVDETGSTNSDLLTRAAAGEDIDGTVLIAERQVAGRGRMARTWASSAGQIALSVGVRPAAVAIDRWGWLPLLAGVAVVDAVAAEAGVQAGLKWPNDVLVEDRKLAGILCEVATANSFVVIGIGLNVTLSSEEAGDTSAISLVDLDVAEPDRHRLIRRLLLELGRRISNWRDAGGVDDGLVSDYRARSLTIGSRVRAVLPGDRALIGTAQGIDDEGRLVIESGGAALAVAAGDIIHLRPEEPSGF
jgi:BirA family biotin operon repressor/biotin-[acetyl-CoA-carboxylase] ligase